MVLRQVGHGDLRTNKRSVSGSESDGEESRGAKAMARTHVSVTVLLAHVEELLEELGVTVGVGVLSRRGEVAASDGGVSLALEVTVLSAEEAVRIFASWKKERRRTRYQTLVQGGTEDLPEQPSWD